MKKILISSLLTLSMPVFSNQCPQLEGSYNCVFEDEEHFVISVEQQTLSTKPELVSYGLDVLGTGGPDFMLASTRGEADRFGYITTCKDQQLVASSSDGSILKLFLSEKQELVRSVNGAISWKCPKL